jgi:hypothetical protein
MRRRPTAAVRIRLDNPALVPSLLEFLAGTVSCVTEQVGEREIEVSLLGSYEPGTHELTVGLLLRAWEAAREISADAISQT